MARTTTPQGAPAGRCAVCSFFFSSRRRHTRCSRDWSSDVCSSDLWHVHEGRKLTGPQLARMEAKRTELYQRTRQFMEKYEFFVLPVNQVLPFDVKTHYPTEIAGVKMETYMAWMKSAYYISAVGHPAMSVPCAFSEKIGRAACRERGEISG